MEIEEEDIDVESDNEVNEEDVEAIDLAELESLKNKKRKTIELPRRGMKDMFEEENSVSRIQEKRKKLFDMLTNIERKPKLKSLSVGVYREDSKSVEITVTKGKHLKNVGRFQNGKLHLYPEETVFLIDIGVLEVYRNGMPISLQESHVLLYNQPHYTYDHYIVYSHLKRLGYVVLRTDVYEKKVVNKPKDSGKSLEPTKEREYHRVIENVNKPCRGWWPASEESGGMEEPVEVIPVHEDAPNRVFNYGDLKTVQPYSLDNTNVNLEELVKKKDSISFRIAFDVYQSNSYKRTANSLPDYRLCVTSFRERAPNLLELEQLTLLSEVPLRFCVVDVGTINFVDFNL